MLGVILLLAVFTITAVWLLFLIDVRRHLKPEVYGWTRDYWVNQRDKYGPGISVRLPPKDLLTEVGLGRRRGAVVLGWLTVAMWLVVLIRGYFL